MSPLRSMTVPVQDGIPRVAQADEGGWLAAHCRAWMVSGSELDGVERWALGDGDARAARGPSSAGPARSRTNGWP
ncbi:MAG TPA: hypothetical protein VMV92_45020 [Streptosporangiaceae bacterium]|nr:hypothetical protein [Streptosporangiaceae bacterium]